LIETKLEKTFQTTHLLQIKLLPWSSTEKSAPKDSENPWRRLGGEISTGTGLEKNKIFNLIHFIILHLFTSNHRFAICLIGARFAFSFFTSSWIITRSSTLEGRI